MKKLIIFSLIILLILTGLLAFISSINSDLGNYISVPEHTSSYTKALCNSTRYCQDYEIFCENKNIIGMRFTGAAIQFSSDWQDPRNEDLKKLSC